VKIRNIILLTTFSFLVIIHVISAQSKKADLPVINFSKDYPKKEIRLQDIADIEYVPLETTDDILLSGEARLSFVSEKYILVHEPRHGDIFVFNRNGKIHSHFNHKGQSGQEYTWMAGGAIFDEKNEEIFVCSQSIQVYSLLGEYKRTLKISTIENDMKVYNFDDETLLIYEGVSVDPYFKREAKAKPYTFISKKDGSVVSVLNLHLPKRYSNRFPKIEGKMWAPIIMYYSHNPYYGQDYVIADMSSDTLYLLTTDKKLTPLLTREPSVHASIEPRTIWTPLLTTDRFLIIGLVLMDFSSRGGRIPILMYEFETGEISNVSFLGDQGKWTPGSSSPISKNMSAKLVDSQKIINDHKRKKLGGNVEKFARTLNEDDNPVVKIVNFNK